MTSQSGTRYQIEPPPAMAATIAAFAYANSGGLWQTWAGGTQKHAGQPRDLDAIQLSADHHSGNPIIYMIFICF